jgi:hypothetical protein
MNRRLDSWKAIAEYLGRDAATARRWEKTLGLPVHRVAGGAGRSVFAYTNDIDAWLASSATAASAPPAPAGDVTTPVDPPTTVDVTTPVLPDVRPIGRRSLAARAGVAAAAAFAMLGTAWWATASRAATAPLRVTVNERRVVAADERGMERWRYDFPAGTQTALPSFGHVPVVVGGENPAVYVATSHRYHLPEGPTEGGELLAFDGSGRRTHTFSFADEVTVGGTKFGAPWVLTDFALTRRGDDQAIAVSAHHYMWSPSLVTVIDRDWRRRGTWTHDGWIEQLEWIGPQRVVAGGFDQEHNGGLAVLLDTVKMEPMRMIVMPRSEINLVTASRFNRAIIEPVNDRVLARTVEMPEELSQGAIDVIYEFTLSLDLLRASFSGRYWEMHRSLELQGKLKHTQANCPDRNGPREILVWEPSKGWRTQALVPQS